MKFTLTLSLLTALLSIHAMDQPAPNTQGFKERCSNLLSGKKNLTPDQIRLCIKVAAQSNDPIMLTELFDKHLKKVENYYRKKEVISVMPNLIVTCSVDDHVDALRVLLKQGDVTYDTFKGAFLRAAAEGAFKAIDVLISHHKGEIDSHIGTDAIITAHRAGHESICYYLLYLPKVLHDPTNRDIIKIQTEIDDEEIVDVTDPDYIEASKSTEEKHIPSEAPIPTGAEHRSMAEQNPYSILLQCQSDLTDKTHQWQTYQLSMCVQAAAQANEADFITELLKMRDRDHLTMATNLMESLIVACSMHYQLDVLRALLNHHQLSSNTFQAAFLGAVSVGLTKPIDILVAHYKGPIDYTIFDEAIRMARQSGHKTLMQYLVDLSKRLITEEINARETLVPVDGVHDWSGNVIETRTKPAELDEGFDDEPLVPAEGFDPTGNIAGTNAPAKPQHPTNRPSAPPMSFEEWHDEYTKMYYPSLSAPSSSLQPSAPPMDEEYIRDQMVGPMVPPFRSEFLQNMEDDEQDESIDRSEEWNVMEISPDIEPEIEAETKPEPEPVQTGWSFRRLFGL